MKTLRPSSPSQRLRFAALLLLLPATFSLVTACQPSSAEPGTGDVVGSLSFPTSAGAEAQAHFIKGVAILHSFGYKQAITEFQAAQQIEPDFALAYWGESFCYNHPLLPERSPEKPREVLARLGATPEERLAKAPTEREKGFLRAAEAMWGEGEAPERRIAYMREMQKLYEQFPDDHEVGAFYSLSLLAAIGPLGDKTYRTAVRAGAIALEIFDENPNHPGAAHYTIHAFDDPIHAPLALPAAWRFSEIAAAVSHARHMPTHIFIQHGMWNEVSTGNDSAYQAAVDLWEPGDSVSDMVHSTDWGHYGDLQRGDWKRAKERMAVMDEIVEKSEGADRAVSTVPLMRARYAVETESWDALPVEEQENASELLVAGIAAARAGDLETARKAESKLQELSVREVDTRSTFSRGTQPDQVMRREVTAEILVAQGKIAEAIGVLDEATAIEDAMGDPRGSAYPIKPSHELQGELLLSAERYEEAIDRFNVSLRRTPNRPLSLRGLARAQAALGMDEAQRTWAQLANVLDGRPEHPVLLEAQRELSADGS